MMIDFYLHTDSPIKLVEKNYQIGYRGHSPYFDPVLNLVRSVLPFYETISGRERPASLLPVPEKLYKLS